MLSQYTIMLCVTSGAVFVMAGVITLCSVCNYCQTFTRVSKGFLETREHGNKFYIGIGTREQLKFSSRKMGTLSLV